MQLLKDLSKIHSPSGEENKIAEYILYYIVKNSKKWKVKPEIFFGDEFHDNIVLKFGKPTTAIFAHVDTTGFTVRYDKQLIPIGGPAGKTGDIICGTDKLGKIECVLEVDTADYFFEHNFHRKIIPGTSLTYKPDFKEDEDFILSPYLDNRIGVYAALKLAETLENGVIAFTTYEEHRGGGAEIISKYIYEHCNVQQALILDVTWVTNGVVHGGGPAVSLRDSGIPRRVYIDKIFSIIEDSGIKYQLEVEETGGSDGTAIQRTAYPINWCFIGPPVNNVHSSNETIMKSDIVNTIKLYKLLLKKM